MKKLLFVICIPIFFSLSVFAQPKSKVFDNWHININGGPTFFLGDVTQHFKWYEPDLSTPRGSFGIMLIKEFNCVLSMRGQLGYGWSAGKKDFYAGGDPANLSFEAHFYHFNAQAKINFIDLIGGGKCFRKFNFYGFAGIGFINFQNRLYQNGFEVLSWGYGRVGTHKWVTEIIVPFGLGTDVRLGQKFRINLDVEAIWVDGEKLDRVVGMYSHDVIIYPNLGLSYNISKNNRVCCKSSNIPLYNSDLNNCPQKLNEEIAKSDSLKKLLVQSLVKIDDLNHSMEDVHNKKDSVLLKHDTIYIVKETYYNEVAGTQYSDSVNKTMKDAGYIWYNVYFDLDKYDIKPEYQSIIAKVAGILKNEPELKIVVVGNADQQGQSLHNEILSKNRSQSVINELVNKYGIDRNRLKLDYRGDHEPISKIHFDVNRRVDFIRIQR
jgi:outer membrane protein OmpA-like peptidoglycan-associated protein